jgi:hypothetical protein
MIEIALILGGCAVAMLYRIATLLEKFVDRTASDRRKIDTVAALVDEIHTRVGTAARELTAIRQQTVGLTDGEKARNYLSWERDEPDDPTT